MLSVFVGFAMVLMASDEIRVRVISVNIVS